MLQRMEQLAPGDITPDQACSFVAEFRERLVACPTRPNRPPCRWRPGSSPTSCSTCSTSTTRTTPTTPALGPPGPAEQKDKRYRQFLDRAEMIYGRLDEPQRQALRRDIDRSIFDPARILAERQRRQQEVLQALGRIARERLPLDDARRLLRGSVDRALTPPDAAARAYQEALLAEGCRHFAILHNSTTPAQREAAARRLRAYQRDLRELANGG